MLFCEIIVFNQEIFWQHYWKLIDNKYKGLYQTCKLFSTELHVQFISVLSYLDYFQHLKIGK